METLSLLFENNTLFLKLHGHIDSSNAAATETAINEAVAQYPDAAWVVDADDLSYISSAGLRILLRLKKQNSSTRIANVNAEVYEILDMTGFTEIMDVEKAYRKISVEGCEVIGQGANGKVYRLDPDTIIKVYLNPDSLPDIQRERELARKAFVLGIPTAIPYDVVRVGEGYGSVFELLNATSFLKIVRAHPEKTDEVVQLSVDLLKKIHSTEVKPGDMPDMKEVALGWVKDLANFLPAEEYAKLTRMVQEVPARSTMLHGDYHFKNVMLQNGESLLIDMDTLCTGHPVFELASVYNAYVGFGLSDPSIIENFLGISAEATHYIWRKTLSLYFDTDEKDVLDAMEDKASLMGVVRLLRRSTRRSPDNTELISFLRDKLIALINRVDSLVF